MLKYICAKYTYLYALSYVIDTDEDDNIKSI